MTVIIMLMVSRCVHWILEQPISSVMDFAPVLVDNVLIRLKYKTKMGAYGARTAKPTWLLSSSIWPTNPHKDLLPNFVPTGHSVAIKLPDAPDGRKRVSGGPGLKATQAYPPGYSRAVFNEWLSRDKAEDKHPYGDDIDEISDCDFPEMDHSVAELESVCEHFGVPIDEWSV